METNYLINGPITSDEISKVLNAFGNLPEAGAHSVFFGQVRADEINGKVVEAIEYSAYNDMVILEAEKIKQIIFSEFHDVKAVQIIHSTGIVKAGELSLFVGVSSGHRQQAIDACRNVVELIKEKLPIWKKEIFSDKSHNWK